MDLSEFIRETLRGIVTGVANAQADAEIGKYISPTFRFEMGHQKDHRGVFVHGSNNHTVVEFDVAVTSETAAGAKGGFKVLVLGSASVDAEHTRGTASRIKFSVPILLPRVEGT
jgi:hypothetical protein